MMHKSHEPACRLNGGIPFIENAGGYRSYPYASTSIGRMVKSSEQAILYSEYNGERLDNMLIWHGL